MGDNYSLKLTSVLNPKNYSSVYELVIKYPKDKKEYKTTYTTYKLAYNGYVNAIFEYYNKIKVNSDVLF